MTRLFVDTSAWYPLADAGHPDHGPVSAGLRAGVAAGAQIVTTNMVVAETQALLLRRAGGNAALAFVDAVHQPPNRVEYATPPRVEAAVDQWLRRYTDERFSLTDAISFVVMKELEIREALTLDRHFATAGLCGDAPEPAESKKSICCGPEWVFCPLSAVARPAQLARVAAAPLRSP